MTDVGINAEASTQKEAWPAKIATPEVFTPASPAINSTSDVMAPVAEDVGHDSVAAAAAATAVETSSTTGAPRKFTYISPGLSSVTLPLGPGPKERIDEEGQTPKSVSFCLTR